MSKEDLFQIDGIVTESFSSSRFTVKLIDGRLLMAKLSGKLRRYRIRVLVGDRVTLGLSPYDLTHGLILSRERLAAVRR
jgi:translation initiation factor IF-1